MGDLKVVSKIQAIFVSFFYYRPADRIQIKVDTDGTIEAMKIPVHRAADPPDRDIPLLPNPFASAYEGYLLIG
jgi:hypothetical protein